MSNEQLAPRVVASGYVIKWGEVWPDGSVFTKDTQIDFGPLASMQGNIMVDDIGVLVEFEPTIVDGQLIEMSLVPKLGWNTATLDLGSTLAPSGDRLRKLEEYEALLRQGMSPHEARATVWGIE